MQEPLTLTHLPILQAAGPESFLDRFSPGDVLPFAIVVVVFLAGSVIVFSKLAFGAWKSVRERQLAASLIQDMLDRNMSPPEIQQVIGAWSSASGGALDAPVPPQQTATPKIPPKPVST